jgi:hypothetical protein
MHWRIKATGALMRVRGIEANPGASAKFWNRMEQKQGWGRTQMVEKMVARDGVEPLLGIEGMEDS